MIVGDIEKFLALDIRNGFLFMVACLVVIVVIAKNIEFLADKLGIKTKRMLDEEQQNKTIGKLRERADKTDEKIDKVVECLNNLQLSVESISKQVATMQEKQDKNEMNQLRDRIGQSYRFYKQRGEWNHMEKEAFEGLIQSYEDAGGKNGFVHSVCIPMSEQWKVTDE